MEIEVNECGRSKLMEERDIRRVNVLYPMTLGTDPHLPSGYIVISLWFLNQSAQHIPTGYIVITFTMRFSIRPTKTLRIQGDFFYKVPPPVPGRYV